MIAIAMMMALAAATGDEVTIPGPQGALAGTYQAPSSGDGKGPVVVIIPGSGPTARAGNSPLGLKAQPYKLLAEALAGRGVASVRIDKRGMFGSRAAADANAATIEAYAADARAWAQFAAKRAGAKCAWLVGHSEGGLGVLEAAQDATGICGVILVSGPGRPLGVIMRELLRANPANAPIQPQALAMLDGIDAGRTTDPATLPAPLPMIFPEAVQRYMIAEFKFDPAKLAATARVPVVIVQGDNDIQVSLNDALLLAAAQPKARLVVLPGVNHVLKVVPMNDRAANAASYADPALPIAPAVDDAIATAVAGKGAKQ